MKNLCDATHWNCSLYFMSLLSLPLSLYRLYFIDVSISLTNKVKAKALPPVVVPESSGPSEPSLPADYVKTEVTVESKKIGIIIGPKGVTLHGIQGE